MPILRGFVGHKNKLIAYLKLSCEANIMVSVVEVGNNLNILTIYFDYSLRKLY